ncbi:hypothetical protein D3C77_273590 [compost metagenome]
MGGQRRDPAAARASHVDCGDKGVRLVFAEPDGERVLRGLERHGGAVSDAGGLEHDEFVRRQRLANLHVVRLDCIGERALGQPHPKRGMSAEHQDDRVQAGRFQRRRKQKGGV